MTVNSRVLTFSQIPRRELNGEVEKDLPSTVMNQRAIVCEATVSHSW